MVTEESMNM